MHESSQVNFNVLEFAHLKFLPYFFVYRMNNSKYSWDTGMRGPPGVAFSQGIEIKPILGIEDIISLN